MAIAYRDPLEQLQRELDRMLESAFGSVGASAAGVYPPVNVFDAGEEYVIKAELPGAAAFWPALEVALVWRAVSAWPSRAALTLSVVLLKPTVPPWRTPPHTLTSRPAASSSR